MLVVRNRTPAAPARQAAAPTISGPRIRLRFEIGPIMIAETAVMGSSSRPASLADSPRPAWIHWVMP